MKLTKDEAVAIRNLRRAFMDRFFWFGFGMSFAAFVIRLALPHGSYPVCTVIANAGLFVSLISCLEMQRKKAKGKEKTDA